MPPRFDLQSHSTHSDGALPAAEVVQRAAEAGVELLALSDHDTISGVAEAIEAGERSACEIVPAVEISAVDDGRAGRARTAHPRLRHRPHRPADDRQRSSTSSPTARSARCACATACARPASSSTKRRSRSASRRANRSAARTSPAPCSARRPTPQRLADEEIDDIGSLIRGYLIEGKPAFRLRETPTVAEAIEAIHAAGGVAIWAHPFWDIEDPAEVLASIDRFRALGIDGVEAFYITHDEPQTRLLAERCAELGLLSTGSADYHGPDNRLFSRFLAFETFGIEPNLGPIAD